MAATYPNPPAGLIAKTAANRSRNGSQRSFEHFRDNLLLADAATNSTHLALQRAGIETLGGLMSMTTANINSLKHPDPAAPTDPLADIYLNQHQKSRLHTVCECYWYMCHCLGETCDPTSITYEMYEDFCTSSYDVRKPVPPFGAPLPPVPPPPPAPPAPPAAAPRPIDHTENFKKGIRKDKSHYPDYKDEKNWDAFQRAVRSGYCNRLARIDSTDSTESIMN